MPKKETPKTRPVPQKPGLPVKGWRWDDLWQNRRLEVLSAAAALLFVVGIVYVSVVTDGQIAQGISSAYHWAAGTENLSTGNVVLDCAKPKNHNTPYCAERRGRAKSTWKSISRHGGTGMPVFSLHGGDD